MNPFKCGDSVLVRFDDDDEWVLGSYVFDMLSRSHVVYVPCTSNGFYSFELKNIQYDNGDNEDSSATGDY